VSEGDRALIRAHVTLEERGFSSPCWMWQRHIMATGYGQISIGKRRILSHRFSYEAFVGPIPNGLQVDHLCRVRACCNPSHLEPVTQRENLLRGQGIAARCARVTECPQGHRYDTANTRIRPRGGRECRPCDRARSKRWRERKKEEAL
jgi:hypothetical protein